MEHGGGGDGGLQKAGRRETGSDKNVSLVLEIDFPEAGKGVLAGRALEILRIDHE